MKTANFALLFLIASLYTSDSTAYQLPEYKMTTDEFGTPAESVLSHYESQMDELSKSVSTRNLVEFERNHKLRLTGKERKSLGRYKGLKKSIVFWNYVVNLKKSIIEITRVGQEDEAISEADRLAKIAIGTIYEASLEFQIATSALVRNFLINIGAKENGRCYHYVNKLINALSKYSWQHFDLHWGTAYEGTFRENNALVITAKGLPFENGLAIDAWRTAGKPFWKPVRNDRFPWVEAPNIAYK